MSYNPSLLYCRETCTKSPYGNSEWWLLWSSVWTTVTRTHYVLQLLQSCIFYSILVVKTASFLALPLSNTNQSECCCILSDCIIYKIIWINVNLNILITLLPLDILMKNNIFTIEKQLEKIKDEVIMYKTTLYDSFIDGRNLVSQIMHTVSKRRHISAALSDELHQLLYWDLPPQCKVGV